jgi:hypothetical protein
MTATNHALSGAVIGLAITQPAIALPLALISHFVLDAVPHFGHLNFSGSEKKRRIFHISLFIDAALLAIIIVSLYLAGAGWLVFACLFLAGCPDFFQTYHYLFNPDFKKTGKFKNPGWYARTSKRISWEESLSGLFVEIPLAVVFTFTIAHLL